MGEAKRKYEARRKEFLETLDEWAFPESQWERDTVAEIIRLPVVSVRRYPAHLLSQMNMPPRQCHVNAAFMEKNDPDSEVRQVTGWWPQNENFVLHSVILRQGLYWCVTPMLIPSPDEFDFIPDAKIRWNPSGNKIEAYRDGVEIRMGVRSNPERTLSEIQEWRSKVISEKDPMQAFMIKRENN